jgi:N-acetylglutamate synthase-like GNAT family acetyltransferase
MSENAVTLRKASETDVAAIRALVRAAYEKWISMLGLEPTPVRADYDLAVRAHHIELLFHGEVLAGLIEMKRESDHLLIVNVAVLPEFQKRGFGRLLLARAEAVTAALGLSELRLYTGKLMVENLVLYQRMGYCAFREEPFMHTARVHMKKRI